MKQLVFSFLLVGTAASMEAATYITYSVPGAVSGSLAPSSMNSNGDIVGTFSSGSTHGFLRVANGNITNIDIPGATETRAFGINATGDIVGDYCAGNVCSGTGGPGMHGYLRAVNGDFTTFDAPSAVGTSSVSINASDSIAGVFTGVDGLLHGFIRDASGSISTFDVPNSSGTVPTSINAGGGITGYYYSGVDVHGFVRASNSPITVFDLPGKPNVGSTLSINDSGQIAGFAEHVIGCVDTCRFYQRSFLRETNGGITLIEAPGSPDGTTALSINASGAIVGYVRLRTGDRGFVRDPNGQLTVFNVPGFSFGQAVAINDAGVIMGRAFSQITNTWVGFIRIP